MQTQRMAPESGCSPVLIPSLGRWGLSAHADLVYRTLVLVGPRTSRHLARYLGIEPSRVDRALDELAQVGAVHPALRGPDRQWTAAEVDRVLGLVRRRRAPVLIEDRYRRHMAAVCGLHLDRIPPAGLRRLPTRAAARVRIAELAAAERQEHLAINTEDVITAEAAAVAGPADRSIIARGVRLRALGLPSQDGTRAEVPAGSEYREALKLPLKLMVFDRRSALIPADPRDFDTGAFEISDPGAVASLTQLFYAVWRTADDPSRQEVPPIVLTAREQAIVALLTNGLSEEEAAAELKLSRRTVVYALRALMDRVGVENRWQLALMLGAARAVPLPNLSPSTSPTPTTQRKPTC